MQEINGISINDQFWVQVTKTFTSFGFNDLPHDVHYTFSYHENSNDVNVHLTRNIGNPNNKPKIEIVKINKKVLEKIGPYSMMHILNRFLKPIDLSTYLKKGSRVKFFPIEALENGESANFAQSLLINSFRPLSKIKKTRLKIKEEIGSALEELCTQDELLTSIENLAINIKKLMNSNSRGGILVSKGATSAIIKYNGAWYEYSNDVSPFELLSAVVGDEWAKIITRYAKRALVKIRKATSYQETKIWNDPIVLVANPEFEKSIDEINSNQI